MGKREVKDIKRDLHPLAPLPGAVHETKIKDNKGKTYTGWGWDRSEADKKAGEKYRRGEADKKK